MRNRESGDFISILLTCPPCFCLYSLRYIGRGISAELFLVRQDIKSLTTSVNNIQNTISSIHNLVQGNTNNIEKTLGSINNMNHLQPSISAVLDWIVAFFVEPAAFASSALTPSRQCHSTTPSSPPLPSTSFHPTPLLGDFIHDETAALYSLPTSSCARTTAPYSSQAASCEESLAYSYNRRKRTSSVSLLNYRATLYKRVRSI